VRLIARVTLPGDSVRLRFDNTFGMVPVTFARVTIAPRVRGAMVAPLLKPVTFGGRNAITLPPGGSVQSDAIALRVDAQQDLAVSLFVAGANVQPSQHNNAQVTSYLSATGSGDQTASVDGKPFSATTTSTFWLKSIDVRPTGAASTIVAFGDSITDGTCSTLDAHDRWEDLVAQRLALQTPVRFAVVNEGIGGNTLNTYTPMPNSPPGTLRLERDVLSHAGVSHVVLFMGSNDMSRGASAEAIIAGMKDVTARIKARGLKVIGVTILPRSATGPGNATWAAEKNAVRARVNDWIRKEAGFDGVLDFDSVVRNPGNADLLAPAYNCGDDIHPSPIGYFQMGKSVDLGLFSQR
jgi:lysophospholipase L1-like esterase